jgi:hypothetical protein
MKEQLWITVLTLIIYKKPNSNSNFDNSFKLINDELLISNTFSKLPPPIKLIEPFLSTSE